MKNRVRKDYNKRLALALLETECVTLKALSHNRILPATIRAAVPSSPARISALRNLCRLTGRTRGIVRKLGISNIKFRQLADEGKLSG
jgi:small subunit ribosomal protein S14